MQILRFLVLTGLQVFALTAYPQQLNIQFDHIRTEDGLSQSNVFCIRGDSRGFMWFGTGDGLNRYDGYNFSVFKNNPLDSSSISNNYVTDIQESKNGDLWIATLGGGVCRFDRAKRSFVTYRNDAKNNNSLSHDIVNTLLIDDQQHLWIGTDAGLDVFDPASKKFEHYFSKSTDPGSLSDSYVRYLYRDSHKNIWVGTLSGGLNLFNPATKTFTHFKHDDQQPGSIAGDNIYTLFEDSQHRLWIGTDGNGLDLFEPATNTFRHFKHNDANPNSLAADAVFAINEDAEKNLWIGTENGGLSIFNFSTGHFSNYKNDEVNQQSISNNSICSIYRDAKNNMWIGNFAGGVDLVNRDKTNFTIFNHTSSKSSLSNNHVLNIFEDRSKKIWVGTDGGGLNLFDPEKNEFTHFRHDQKNSQSISADNVLTTCQDSQGKIWIGTWGGGITVYDPVQKTFRRFQHKASDPSSLGSENAWIILEDRDRNIWVGTFGNGVDRLNPDGRTFTHFKFDRQDPHAISSPNIISIFQDSDGELWFCTDGGGLCHFDAKTQQFTRYMHNDSTNSISNNSLSSMMEDSRKNLWIATRRGLNLFNKKTGQFKVFTITDGLPDNSIFGILEDDHKNLWISTNKGISCFDPARQSFKNFAAADGLQSNEFTEQAFCKSSSGYMYFGGHNGFNRFFPDSVRPVPFDPPLVLTNFQLFNKNVPIAVGENDPSPLKKSITETSTITLPYASSVFSFEFASLNYTSREKKRYAYMLEGFDKNWNETGTSRTASYTHLDPGKYLLRVRGLNNSGEWSSREKTLELIIRPPFWLTWWFKLLGILAVLGSATGFYRLRVKTIKGQRAKLQNQVEAQTQQLKLSAGEELKARKEAERARATAELANDELLLKNKELEQFAYVASHDLQEPLRTTSGFVELIQQQYQGKIDEKADRYLNFISDASNRMKVLISDLLDFSRIGTNVELQQIDCNLTVKNMLADIMTAIQESGAEIQVMPLPVIYGYATEIKLLFQNLVLNAIKFRKKSAPLQITIDAKPKGDFWQFTISDNGIGIDKKNSQRIFEIFQRLHTRKDYPGSGIGLAHCKKIVELHKGKIWVESEPGKGSVFYFTLAARQEQFLHK